MGDPQLAGVIALTAVGVGLAGWLVFRAGRRCRRCRAKSQVLRVAPNDGAPAPGPRETLRTALQSTRQALSRGIGKAPGSREANDYLAGVEEAFLLADVGVRTTESVLSRVRGILRPGTNSSDVGMAVRGILRDILSVAGASRTAEPTQKPLVILLVGVNGVGKTTTIGKLAARHIAAGDSVLLVAADTFRAAAAEQLERWGSRVGTAVIRQQAGADPAAVVVDGLRAARTRKYDVVIIDTAGRLHTKTNLMAELCKIRRVASRECPGAPHATLLVLDATTGQNGVQQARVFKEELDVTGVVLTKMDGTARGGIAVAVAADLGIPVSYLGLGEAVDDLQPFDPDDFVDALLNANTAGGAGSRGEGGSSQTDRGPSSC